MSFLWQTWLIEKKSAFFFIVTEVMKENIINMYLSVHVNYSRLTKVFWMNACIYSQMLKLSILSMKNITALNMKCLSGSKLPNQKKETLT